MQPQDEGVRLALPLAAGALRRARMLFDGFWRQ